MCRHATYSLAKAWGNLLQAICLPLWRYSAGPDGERYLKQARYAPRSQVAVLSVD